MKLAGSYAIIRSMRTAVDIKAAGTANSFTAIMIKTNRFFNFVNELLVKNIEHLQKGAIRRYTGNRVNDKTALCPGIFLPPYFQCKIHRWCELVVLKIRLILSSRSNPQLL
jgi:hypothetical protein